MKNQLLSGVAIGAVATALATGTPAQAQTTSHNWTGFYLGLNAGAAFGRSGASTSADCSAPADPPAYFCRADGVGAANVPAVNAAGTGSFNDNAFTGGIQAGFNWQRDRLVYGFEADYGAFRLRGSRQGNSTYPAGMDVNASDPFSVGSSFGTDWLMTFRGRIGTTLTPNLLAYVTGGLALTRLTVANSFSDVNSSGGNATENSSTSAVKTGWVIGAGLEWALSNNWSVKGEYLLVKFGKVTTTGNVSNDALNTGYAQGLSTTSDLTAQIARVGVNYKF